ncbi:MAG: NAD-dependent protein deacylase [Verrucomicrobiales bacterium]
MSEDLDIQKAAEAIRRAEAVLFITGAGVSADSGVPTFRGVAGLYSDGSTGAGERIEDVLSGQMLARDPAKVWRYLWRIWRASAGAEPNAAHEAVAWIESQKPASWVLTQNVDGFHRQAGSRNLIEIHGRIDVLDCLGCAREWATAAILAQADAGSDAPPRCLACGAVLRPRAVLFGEMLPESEVAKLMALEQNTAIGAVVAVGTTGVFPYISEPMRLAAGLGIPTIEINPEPTEAISPFAAIAVRRSAAEALPEIRRRLALPAVA